MTKSEDQDKKADIVFWLFVGALVGVFSFVFFIMFLGSSPIV